MRFKIDWVSLIVGSKFTVFASFYVIFGGKFPSTSPLGAYIWRGDLTEGFLRYWIGGLIFGGAYFRNCTVAFHMKGKNATCTCLRCWDICELYSRVAIRQPSCPLAGNLNFTRKISKR